VAGSYEHGNETSGSIKAGFSRLAEWLLTYQEGLCSMELVGLRVSSFLQSLKLFPDNTALNRPMIRFNITLTNHHHLHYKETKFQ
jgi:hypothetical protein